MKTPVVATPGPTRVDHLAGYRELGIDRVMLLLQDSVDGETSLAALAADATADGVDLA